MTQDDLSYAIDKPPFFAGLRWLGIQFKLIGWAGFWAKLALALVSLVIVLFAAATLNRAPVVIGQTVGVAPPSISVGIPFLIGGVVCLGISVYWSYFFTRLSHRLVVPTPKGQPTKAETARYIKLALITDLIGMLLMVFGAESIGGILLGKAFSQGIGFSFNIDPSRFIQPSDLLVILASIHGITGLFIGIASTLWLLQQTFRQRPPSVSEER
ncbi:MAG TPA: DUF3611 family protein [Stenomitos sp.]